jgi:hypothetical protein
VDLDVRLIAFAERAPQDKGQPILLHVYVINQSAATLRILEELDSINVPQAAPHEGEADSDADLTHIDFGVSGSATFRPVAQGECVKMTLLLRDEQFALLEHARRLKTAVKLQDGSNDEGNVRSLLLPAAVYLVTS